MSFKIVSTHLNGVVVIKPDVYRDDRGWFMETYREDEFKWHGIPDSFVQDNQSWSNANVIRGLHFQWDPPMGKLMRVTHGSAFLVAVDVRKGSPNLGKWFGIHASEANMLQVWAPAGFARGFYSYDTGTVVQYKCTALYNKDAEGGIFAYDNEPDIDWPCGYAQLSEKDKSLLLLREWLQKPESDNFKYGE